MGRVVAIAYVVTVAAIATFGFTTESTAGILLAAALALPSGVPALIGYYLAYGLLTQLPGGDAASWFVPATEAVGVLALTVAALLNVVVLRSLRGSASASGRTRSGA
jgi:hypothetical protein